MRLQTLFVVQICRGVGGSALDLILIRQNTKNCRLSADLIDHNFELTRERAYFRNVRVCGQPVRARWIVRLREPGELQTIPMRLDVTTPLLLNEH